MSDSIHFDPFGTGFGFVVTPKGISDFCVDVDVLYVTSRGGTDQLGVMAPLEVSADTEPYLDAHMKWDGCMHFWFKHGDEDGYYHWCGVNDLLLHTELIRYLHRMAYEWMGRSPQPGETWPVAVTEATP